MKLLQKIFSQEVLLSTIFGVLYVMSYPPVGFWPLSIVAYGLFTWFLFERSSESKKNFWYFFKSIFVFSMATRLSGLYWIPHTLVEFSDFHILVAWVMGILAFVLMSLSGSVVAGLLGPQVFKVKKNALRVLAIFIFWIVWDYCDYRFFPWEPVQSFGGQKQLLASAGVFGTLGWNLIFYGLISSLHFAWTNKITKRVGAWSVAWVLMLCLGAFLGQKQIESLQQKYSSRQKVALLQGAVGNFEKKLQTRDGAPTNENVLRIYRDLIEKLAVKQKSESLGEVFVFWPETSFPGFPLNDSSLSELLSSWAKITGGFHMIGAYEEDSVDEGTKSTMYQYNVVAAYSSSGEFRGHYRKVVRMPFGEYVPGDQYFPWIYETFPFLNNFGKGARHVPLPHDNPQGPVFLPFICFETLDEAYVKEAVRSAKEQFPGRDIILVNPTNDSWFGEGAELFLHSHLAIWQAAREGLPFIRPTNTGISMVVAPWGEILARGRVGVETMVFTEVPVTKAIH
ncbi:MAG: apolipoprotein N-acyltransferase [Bdellovibrionota bacterium]